MKFLNRTTWIWLIAGSFALAGAATPLFGQSLQPLPIGQELLEAEPYTVNVRYFCETGSDVGHLIIEVELATGRYLYGLTQPGNLATRIDVSLGEDARIDGALRAATPPAIKDFDEFLQDRSEKHYGKATFVLPIRKTSARPPQQWTVAVRMNGQVCSESSSCVAIRNEVIKGKFSELDESTREILAKMSTNDPLQRR